jgi:hypothetical protein
MSKSSGDTARFNRLRKHKIMMRTRSRELRAAIEARTAAEAAKPKE